MGLIDLLRQRQPQSAVGTMPDVGQQSQRQPMQTGPKPRNVQAQEQAMMGGITQFLMADDRLPLIGQKLESVSAEELPGAIGHTAASAVLSVEASVESQGKDVPAALSFKCMFSAVAMVIDIANHMGLFGEAVDLDQGASPEVQQVAQQALQAAMQVWGNQARQSGRLSDGDGDEGAIPQGAEDGAG